MRLHLKRAIHKLHGAFPIRVTLDGQDITADCYAADAVHGFALCYQRGANGRLVVGADGQLVQVMRRGQVDIWLDIDVVAVNDHAD